MPAHGYSLTCLHCGWRYKLHSALKEGLQVRCSKCGNMLVAPSLEACGAEKTPSAKPAALRGRDESRRESVDPVDRFARQAASWSLGLGLASAAGSFFTALPALGLGIAALSRFPAQSDLAGPRRRAVLGMVFACILGALSGIAGLRALCPPSLLQWQIEAEANGEAASLFLYGPAQECIEDVALSVRGGSVSPNPRWETRSARVVPCPPARRSHDERLQVRLIEETAAYWEISILSSGKAVAIRTPREPKNAETSRAVFRGTARARGGLP